MNFNLMFDYFLVKGKERASIEAIENSINEMDKNINNDNDNNKDKDVEEKNIENNNNKDEKTINRNVKGDTV